MLVLKFCLLVQNHGCQSQNSVRQSEILSVSPEIPSVNPKFHMLVGNSVCYSEIPYVSRKFRPLVRNFVRQSEIPSVSPKFCLLVRNSVRQSGKNTYALFENALCIQILRRAKTRFVAQPENPNNFCKSLLIGVCFIHIKRHSSEYTFHLRLNLPSVKRFREFLSHRKKLLTNFIFSRDNDITTCIVCPSVSKSGSDKNFQFGLL